MQPVVEFTVEKCYSCGTTWESCTLEQREAWGKFISAATGRYCRVCHTCAVHYREKSQASTHRSSSNQMSREMSSTPFDKLVSNAQRGTGRVPVREISRVASTSTPRSGYTQSHANFNREMDKYKKKAGGFVGSVTTPVQVKVTMVQPIKKGAKVTFVPINEDLWAIVPVSANIGMEALRRECIKKLRSAWDQWLYGYRLEEEDATLFAPATGGHRVVVGDSCILDLFLKKSRGKSTAVPNYDFSSVLELSLHLSSAFCEAVSTHCLVEQNRLQSTSAEGAATNRTIATSRVRNRGRVGSSTQMGGPMRSVLPLPQRVYRSTGAANPTSVQVGQAQRSVRGLERTLSDLALNNAGQQNETPESAGEKRVAPDLNDSNGDQPRKMPRARFIPDVAQMRAVLRSQGSSHDHFRRSRVFFKVMPVRTWSKDIFHEKLNLLQIERVQGHLEANLDLGEMKKGAFKTAHPGQVFATEPNKIPACFSGKICVKQVYSKSIRGSIARLGGAEEYSRIVKELICLDWGAILLSLTYQFIEEAVADYGEPLGGIPDLRFVRTMLAQDTEREKSYLIEEWIDDTTEFIKYINNGCPVPCVQPDAPEEVHRIAEFLCFAQHVQYNETNGYAYTSDYQGSGGVLTDPQIISHPSLGRIFGDGNTSKGILRFRVDHDCSTNLFCKHFHLMFLDNDGNISEDIEAD